MSFLQIIPEPGQLLLLGAAFILAGVLFRKIQKAVPAVQKALPAEPRPSKANKAPASNPSRSPLVPMSAQIDSHAALVQE